MTTTSSTWGIEAVEPMRRVRVSERDASRRIASIADLHVHEVCSRCRGNGCEACRGVGTIEVSP